MKVDVRENSKAAISENDDVLIGSVNDALDLMSVVSYELGCSKAVLRKENISEEFFDLKTGLAGEILQKYVNYCFKIAVVGDFSGYPSKALKDFIYECNHGKQVFFLPTEEEALTALHAL